MKWDYVEEKAKKDFEGRKIYVKKLERFLTIVIVATYCKYGQLYDQVNNKNNIIPQGIKERGIQGGIFDVTLDNLKIFVIYRLVL